MDFIIDLHSFTVEKQTPFCFLFFCVCDDFVDWTKTHTGTPRRSGLTGKFSDSVRHNFGLACRAQLI